MKNQSSLLYSSFPILHKLLINCLPVNIFILDKAGYIVWGNPRMIKTLNETDDSFIGKHISYWGEDKWEACKKVLSEGHEQVIEEVGIDQRIYLTNRIPVKEKIDGDTIQGIIGISLDITEQKQAHIAKQEFMQNMAHDIRTPLAGIIGLAQLQKEGMISVEELQEYGEMAYNASHELLELLNAVIETLDTQTMQDTVKAEPLSLFELGKDMEAFITPSVYTTKGVSFQLDLDPNLPLVLTDKIKLKRILINLLSNAIKFRKKETTSTNTITLSIKLVSNDHQQAKIEMRVNDTGIGIPYGKLDRIFERFYRIHPSYLAEYKGYGIGLYLVKEITELLGGTVAVESQEGNGSCFTLQFRFPLADRENNYQKSPTQPVDKPQINEKETVLVAEDNALVLMSVKLQLEKAGYAVVTAKDGKEALDALQKQHLNWALLDIGLPHMQGTEAARIYRQWEQENNKPHLPIFALTGHSVDKVAVECKDVGIDNVFTKPLNDKILQEIKAFIHKLS